MLAKRNKKSFKVLRFGSFFLFLSLISLSTYFLTKYILRDKNPTQEVPVALKQREKPTGVQLAWETYKNTEFGYEISHPKLLYKREFKNQGGYLDFVRFEETKFSVEKGVALGVRRVSLEEEVDRIKKDLDDSSAKLKKEREVFVDNLKGVRLDFEPNSPGVEEARSIVLVYRDGLTFSISSVPGQIERLIESFHFL